MTDPFLPNLTARDKIRNAEIMFGTGSKKHLAAIKRFGDPKPKPKPRRVAAGSADRHEDALRALEKRAVKRGAGDWIATVEKLRQDDEAGNVEAFTARLNELQAPALETPVMEAVSDAADLGAEHALDMIDARAPDGVLGQPTSVRAAASSPVIPRSTSDRVSKLERDAAAALRQALQLSFIGGSTSEILTPLRVSSNAIQRDVITTIHETASSAVVDVARTAGARLVWVAERDACAHCLAMQGQVVDAGASPDFSQTYAARPLPTPPSPTSASRHPRCRCQWEVVYSDEYVDALKREADRSILRGFSLPNESEKVRVDAAARLLEQGVEAPKSVKAYAERAVRRGAFPTRAVPSG
jgi:hypothetical protein